MTFAYTVRDPLGKVHDGTIDAASREDAAQKLVRDGFSVVKLEEDEGGGLELNLFPRRIRKAEIIYATSQLSIMVDTGITLSAALEGIAEQEENPSLKKLLMELKDRVEGGEDFSTALARHPKHFDMTYISLVKSSEHTGTLGAMLDQIASYLRKELETGGKIRGAMAYPAVMLVVAVGVTVFLLTFVMPKFEPLFASRGTQLPKPTIAMLYVSKAMINYWYLWLGGAITLLVGYLVFRRTAYGRTTLDWVKINLPILGPLFRKVTLSRSIRTLGTMVKSGVSMLDAIQLTADVAGNCHYRRVWEKVLDRVTAGDQICDALHGNPLFPPTLVQMISSGEETGKLPAVLEKVSTHYDQEVDGSIKMATSLIEPIMITVMGFVVGGIAMSLLLPIFSLSRGG